MSSLRYAIVLDDEIMTFFDKECLVQFCSYLYDEQLKNKRNIYLNVSGVSISVKREFDNATQRTYLVIYGKSNICRSLKKEINIKIIINTDLYESYSYKINKGILCLTLNEIIHEEPKFECLNEKKEISASGKDEN